jgi:hypothetical protein
MKSGHESETIVERETEATLIVARENHADCKETDTLIQVNRCPDCGEVNMVLCSDNGGGEFINLQVPPEAISYVLGEFQREVETVE